MGRVSGAFNDWFWIDRDQRAFLTLGVRFAHETYERLWLESGEEPGYEDGPDQLDSFEAKIHGLHERDFTWMHAAGILRDAVTSFEVYLEKAREEIMRHQDRWTPVPNRSPSWGELRSFYNTIDSDIETDEVRGVRDLRHLLTHRRGELRTEEARERYADGADPFASVVELDEATVVRLMATLGDSVRAIDPDVYAHTWGGRELPSS